MAIETQTPVPAAPVDDFPWEPYGPTPMVSAVVHVIAPEPHIQFSPHIMPSFTITESKDGNDGRLTVSLNGTAEQRATFAASLREMADRIEAWTEADASAEPVR